MITALGKVLLNVDFSTRENINEIFRNENALLGYLAATGEISK
jgi:hypothetical protein